jgi:hypothetical protein
MMNESQMNMKIRRSVLGVIRKLLELTRIESWPEAVVEIPIKEPPRSGMHRRAEESPRAPLGSSRGRPPTTDR